MDFRGTHGGKGRYRRDDDRGKGICQRVDTREKVYFRGIHGWKGRYPRGEDRRKGMCQRVDTGEKVGFRGTHGCKGGYTREDDTNNNKEKVVREWRGCWGRYEQRVESREKVCVRGLTLGFLWGIHGGKGRYPREGQQVEGSQRVNEMTWKIYSKAESRKEREKRCVRGWTPGIKYGSDDLALMILNRKNGCALRRGEETLTSCLIFKISYIFFYVCSTIILVQDG